MAHSAKTGISVNYSPRAILSRPKLSGLIGAVAAEWSRVEHVLTFLYANLMGAAYLPTIAGAIPALHPIALQVFDTLETQHHRLQLLEKLASWVIKDPAMLKSLKETVIPAIASAAKLRNTLMHANWGISADYPDELIHNPIFGPNLVYGESDFEEAVERAVNASKSIRAFSAEIAKVRGA